MAFRLTLQATHIMVKMAHDLRQEVVHLEGHSPSFNFLPTELTGRIMLCASVLERLEKSDARPRPFPKWAVSQFRAFRNRVAHNPDQVSIGLRRGTIKSMEHHEFRRAFVTATRVARERVQYLFGLHRHDLNRAFAHARDGGWLVDIGPRDVIPLSETTDPRHLFILVQETLAEHFAHIGFRLAPIFPSQGAGHQGKRGVEQAVDVDQVASDVVRTKPAVLQEEEDEKGVLAEVVVTLEGVARSEGVVGRLPLGQEEEQETEVVTAALEKDQKQSDNAISKPLSKSARKRARQTERRREVRDRERLGREVLQEAIVRASGGETL